MNGVLVAYLHAFLGFFPSGRVGHLLVPLLFRLFCQFYFYNVEYVYNLTEWHLALSLSTTFLGGIATVSYDLMELHFALLSQRHSLVEL